MEINGAPQLFGYILQNNFLFVQQNKDIYSGLEELDGE